MATCASPVVEDPVEFVSYEKMPSDTNMWLSRRLDSLKQWVALEKVHGANLSFTAQRVEDAVSVRVARRGAYLKEGEFFFGIHEQEGFLDGETRKIKQLYGEVYKMFQDGIVAVTVYGELFGGSYPHPSVPAQRKFKPVQREVVYCPDLKFMAYDIAVTQPSPAPPGTGASEQQRSYLDYDVCMKLFLSCDLFYAEPLVTGTLQAMLDYPLGFTSTLPSKFGLPPLLDKENIAEGMVIKPVKNLVLPTKTGDKRVIFKRKVAEFAETKPRGRRDRKKGTEYNPDYELLKSEMLAMITEQRLVNVVSKLGLPVSDDDTKLRDEWKGIQKGLVSDVLQEMAIEHEELWSGFQQSEPRLTGRLREVLHKECAETVRTYRKHDSNGTD